MLWRFVRGCARGLGGVTIRAVFHWDRDSGCSKGDAYRLPLQVSAMLGNFGKFE